MKIQTDYKTIYGTNIPASTLRKIRQDILDNVDWQKTLVDHLRDIIPQHDEDVTEANEVYNHVLALMEEEGEIE